MRVIAKRLLIGLTFVVIAVSMAALYPIAPGTSASPASDPSQFTTGLTNDLQHFVDDRDTIDTVVVASSSSILFQHGITHVPINSHSVRKSVMAVLIGKAVHDGDLDVSVTLEDIGIDDAVMPLTATEKQGRVVDLLKARSGIYIEAAGETPEMKAMRPQRGQYSPGEHYYYNNWDFNVLGSILSKSTDGKSVRDNMVVLGDRLGFQDFKPGHLFMKATDGSEHDQYVLYISARDLAAIGQLMLRDGRDAEGDHIISDEWVRQSTTKYSELTDFAPLDGYGYLWSIDSERKTYWATGWGGQYMLVDPANDLVIVTRNDTGRRLGHVIWSLLGKSGQGRRSDMVKVHEMILNDRRN